MGVAITVLIFVTQTDWATGWPLAVKPFWLRTPLGFLLWMGQNLIGAAMSFLVSGLCVVAASQCAQYLRGASTPTPARARAPQVAVGVGERVVLRRSDPPPTGGRVLRSAGCRHGARSGGPGAQRPHLDRPARHRLHPQPPPREQRHAEQRLVPDGRRHDPHPRTRPTAPPPRTCRTAAPTRPPGPPGPRIDGSGPATPPRPPAGSATRCIRCRSRPRLPTRRPPDPAPAGGRSLPAAR